MRDNTVCAVVVTYNRKNLLFECLEAIRKHTRPVDAIYIIDNASTDETPEVLKENGYILELPPFNLSEPYEIEHKISNLVNGNSINVFYVRMHENTGSAGGFYEGVKRGYERGYDWLWLMDDDVAPHCSTLEKLFIYTAVSFCIHPTKVNIDGSPAWEHLAFQKDEFSYSFFEVDSCCFEGMLIHRELLSKTGFPDKRFFIVLDDVEFGIRVKNYTKIIYVREAKMTKLVKYNILTILGYKKREVFPHWKNYYYVRNLILLHILYPRGKYNFLHVIYRIFRKFLSVLIFGPHRLKCVRAITLGIIDGYKGQFGRCHWIL